MRVLDLCSGIGGFSLGLERAGMETVAFCEIEEFPRKVLSKHWPELPIYNDVRTLTAKRLKQDGIGSIDVICGGYPCQPFSFAGKRGGQEDDRHIWPEFNRLIQELRPSWFIGENVAGHISMGLDSVLSDLEGQGYTWEAFVIPAVAIDAKHRRDRVWIIANCDGSGLREQSRGCGGESGKGSLFTELISKTGASTDNDSSGRIGAYADKRKANAWTDGWNLAPWCGGGEIKPTLGRDVHGVPDRVDRLRGLGNAVVPQIPEIIGRAIMEMQ